MNSFRRVRTRHVAQQAGEGYTCVYVGGDQSILHYPLLERVVAVGGELFLDRGNPDNENLLIVSSSEAGRWRLVTRLARCLGNRRSHHFRFENG